MDVDSKRKASFRTWVKEYAAIGALLAFIVTTVFNAIAAHDSKESSRAAARSADIAAQSIAIEEAPTLLVSCSFNSVEVPNTPAPLLLLVSDPTPPGLTSSLELFTPMVSKLEPHTYEKCRFYNYGRLPIVNAYVDYFVGFFPRYSFPKSTKAESAMKRRKYTLFFSAVPGNSSTGFSIVNIGPSDAIAIPGGSIRYQSPPDYKRKMYSFHLDSLQPPYLRAPRHVFKRYLTNTGRLEE